MDAAAGSSVLARPSAVFLLAYYQARSSDIPGSLSSTSRQKAKQNKTRQEKRKQEKKKKKKRQEKKKQEKKKKKKPDSQYFNTREDRGGAQEKRLENVLNLPLASGMVLLHITRLSPEQENILCPMATSKVDWIIRILGNSSSGDVKGTKSKEK